MVFPISLSKTVATRLVLVIKARLVSAARKCLKCSIVAVKNLLTFTTTTYLLWSVYLHISILQNLEITLNNLVDFFIEELMTNM